MTELNQAYKCSVCWNMTEVVHAWVGTLVCCWKDMNLLNDNIKAEMATEKHIPIVEKNWDIVKVKVWEVPHPMTPEHYIEWIEVISADKIYRKQLKPDQAPEGEFLITEEIIAVREYCNLHWLRKNQ